MAYQTKDLPKGEERGFSWVRVVGENGRRFHFAFPPGTAIPDEVDFGDQRYQGTRGPFPFSGKDFPEQSCLRDQVGLSEFNWQEWLDEQVPRPASCEIEIEIVYMRKDIRLHATTYRRGRVETVTKRIDGEKDIVPQIKDAYGYFERNCPAPTDEERKAIAISTVGQAILHRIKKEGLDLLRDWHARMEERYWGDTSYGYPALSLDGILFEKDGISKVVFDRRAEHRQILVAIDFAGGHSYAEDDKGATTIVKGEYGETIVSGAKGRPLSVYLGVPGAGEQMIRVSKAERDPPSIGSNPNHRMRLRSSVENVALEIPEGTEDSDDQVMDDLRELIGPDGYFIRAEDGVMTHLSMFDARTMRRVLSILKADRQVGLEDHGGPQIRLKSPGGHISIDYAKDIALPSPDEIYGAAA